MEHRTEEEPLVLLKLKYLQRKCILPLKTVRKKNHQFNGELYGGIVVYYRVSFHFVFGRGWGGWACFDLGFGGFLLHHSLLLSSAEPFDSDFAP